MTGRLALRGALVAISQAVLTVLCAVAAAWMFDPSQSVVLMVLVLVVVAIQLGPFVAAVAGPFGALIGFAAARTRLNGWALGAIGVGLGTLTVLVLVVADTVATYRPQTDSWVLTWHFLSDEVFWAKVTRYLGARTTQTNIAWTIVAAGMQGGFLGWHLWRTRENTRQAGDIYE